MISVIVPVYNVEPYVSRCIESIINQSYQSLEIILVDDGSTDNSGKICDKYAQKDIRIKVIHKENGGLSSARNAGLDVAKGDYITFVDSDDYLALDIYHKMIDTLMGKSENVIANMMFCRVDENGKTTPSSVIHSSSCVIQGDEYLRELLLHKGDVSVCTKLFPTKLINNVRFVQGKCNEDLLFMLEVISKINKIYFVGQIGYYYFSRSGSISSGYGKAVCDMVENSLIAYDFIRQQYPKLENEAFRFVVFQHMAYLLLVPDEHVRDSLYITALSRIRNWVWRMSINRYLSIRQKLIILGLSVCPRSLAHYYQNRRKV